MSMAILLIALSLMIFAPPLGAQEIKPLYRLPEKISVADESEPSSAFFVVGSDSGLYRITNSNNAIPLWTEGRVEQILRVTADAGGIPAENWYFRTSKGVLYSSDLVNFEERNTGLPFLTIKKYDAGEVRLERQIQMLKDISVNPFNPLELVVATKDDVFITRDGGMSWMELGSMSALTPGVKAVAVVTLDSETVVFMSHPIFGFSYILPFSKNAKWQDVPDGFEMMKSLSSPDEISDIFPVVRTGADGSRYAEIYVSQMYLPCIYRFDWNSKKAELVYKGAKPADALDGLTVIDDVLLFTELEGFGSLDLNSFESPGIPANFSHWNNSFASVPGMISCAWVPKGISGFSEGLQLNELWMLYPGTVNTPYAEKADGKKSIYVSAYQCRLQSGIDKFKKIIKENGMNSLVIDMKDDYGFLRYDTRDPLLLQKGKVSQYAVNLDHFIEEFKKENIYLIARIVVFKDRNLAGYGGSKYAVWDKVTGRPWLGIKGYEDVSDATADGASGRKTLYYDEHWVDPYSEEVWEYNVAVAKELINRGFDEIQFDYIRFPTDGYNLRNARYRWQNQGMDKESALISFLSYARANIDAPIGIDIYGANGWYRSGTRTGQDAELLAEYVDVIGPMFYPSHFEQSFLNYAPAADRTYRIYYYGSFRNTVMCRNRVLVRPWVQAFYLNVSYDRLYYDSDYIKKQYFGVRDSVNHGYMCWNNSGDYTVLPPDITDGEPFIGTSPESSPDFRKPAIGTMMKPLYVDPGISVLDSILEQHQYDYYADYTYTPFLQTQPFLGGRTE